MPSLPYLIGMGIHVKSVTTNVCGDVAFTAVGHVQGHGAEYFHPATCAALHSCKCLCRWTRDKLETFHCGNAICMSGA